MAKSLSLQLELESFMPERTSLKKEELEIGKTNSIWPIYAPDITVYPETIHEVF